MSAVLKQPDLYQQLLALPENITGEIIAGELHTAPRPAAPHVLAAAALGGELYNPFHKGSGGPGGWWILTEPEVHFVRDSEVVVPDLAGWRRERMPVLPEDHRFEVTPDWVCEILSPSTQKRDRVLKKKLYADYGVSFLWLLDPMEKLLETYTLSNGQWLVSGVYQDEDKVCAAPFEAIEIALSEVWAI
jgi:Uma2 family endonuclease